MDRDERLVGVSLRAAREDHRHRERDVLPDGPLYAQAIAGVLLFCFKVVVFVLLLRLMDVIP